MEKILCLVKTGHPLTQGTLDVLFSAAQELMVKSKKKQKIKSEEPSVRGEIWTKYKLAMLGSVCGFVFHCGYEDALGTAEMEFIARPHSQELLDELMQDGAWVRANRDFVPEIEPWRN